MKSEKLRKFAYLFLIFAAVTVGCQNTSKKISLKEQNDSLLAENERLVKKNDKLQAETEQLTEQLRVVTELPRQARLDAIPALDKIEITSRSGLYDKDKDGNKETLIVYVRAVDDQGDAIKFPGSITIQLWDINAESDKALLRTWKRDPEEIKKLWSGTFMTSYYKLRFDVSELALGTNSQLTINAVFTDYLSGRVAKAQRAIDTDFAD